MTHSDAAQPSVTAAHSAQLRFGQYLVQNAYVDAKAIVAALDLQRERTLPIGKLALRENLLSMKQVFAILNAQIDSSRRFGEIAVGMGFLQPAKIDELLMTQKKLRPPLGELLVELGAIHSAPIWQMPCVNSSPGRIRHRSSAYMAWGHPVCIQSLSAASLVCVP